MARRVFYSFHFKADCWRASQIRNIGVVESSRPFSDNAWESVKRGGAKAIERWIEGQLQGRSCTIVLVGAETANRKWVMHEIVRSWKLRKGVMGIRIHGLADKDGWASQKGNNPFDRIKVGERKLSSIVKLHNPYSLFSSDYQVIRENILEWVEEAIEIRSRWV